MLNGAKKIACRDTFLGKAFNSCTVGLKCAADSLVEAMAIHQGDGGKVEKGMSSYVHCLNCF